jgi:hypothetical protein
MAKRKRTKGQTKKGKRKKNKKEKRKRRTKPKQSRLFVKPEFYIIIEFFCLWVRVMVVGFKSTYAISAYHN